MELRPCADQTFLSAMAFRRNAYLLAVGSLPIAFNAATMVAVQLSNYVKQIFCKIHKKTKF